MGEILLDRGPEGTDIDYQLPSEAVEDLRARIGKPVKVFTETTVFHILDKDPSSDSRFQTVRQSVGRGTLVDVGPEEVVILNLQEGKEGEERVVFPVATTSFDEEPDDGEPKAYFRAVNLIIIGGEIFTFHRPG